MMRDLRKYARDTHIGMLAGFVLLLFVVGDGLIWIFYGGQAALMGLLCLLIGLAPLVLIGAVLFALDRIAKRYRE